MSEQEEATQYAPPAAADYFRESGQLRVNLTLTDASGEVVFEHKCQPKGLLHQLKMRLWRKAVVATEPVQCAFFEQDLRGSTFVYRCAEPVEDGRLYHMLTVPGGAVQVPCCPKHRRVLEDRER